MLDFLFSKLTRITSSGKYIGEIDGLRFLAITLVVFYHLNGFIIANSKIIYLDSYHDYFLMNFFFEQGNIGVPLFFVISGFVLAIPFVNQYTQKGSKVVLEKYYLRRLTRLEPPYIVVIILLFLIFGFITKQGSIADLSKHFIASFFYLSNIVFPETLPRLNCVTWSLEVEVQFYIIAPFIALVYKLDVISRRALLIVLIVLFPIFQFYFPSHVNWLYNHIHFFLTGFFLADLYISRIQLNWPHTLSLIVGLLCFLGFVALDLHEKKGLLIIIPSIIVFYLMALSPENIWNKVFKQKALAVLGGMCYSIYLIHFQVIALVGKQLLKIKFTDFYILDIIIYFIIFIIVVLIASGVFFLFIEKPCMKKEWYKFRSAH